MLELIPVAAIIPNPQPRIQRPSSRAINHQKQDRKQLRIAGPAFVQRRPHSDLGGTGDNEALSKLLRGTQ